MSACCRPEPASSPAPDRIALAEVFRRHAPEVGPLFGHHQRTVESIIKCRTSSLGGHLQRCDCCGHESPLYNSCCNRHCPKCQTIAELRWVQARLQDVLPVEYFHVVFTFPDVLRDLFLHNQRLAYDLLFEAVSETLLEVALRADNLGALIGFTAVLHTWTQQLLYHPHIHCLVPGGGLSPDGTKWIPTKPGFFLPLRRLSPVFRGKLLAKLEQAHAAGALAVPAGLSVKDRLRRASWKRWAIYAKPPVSGPEQVVRYLGRYAFRTAISNERLVSLHDGKVTFRWRDRQDGNTVKLLTLEAPAFIGRFLLHVLPPGYVRIRHYGLLANARRKLSLAKCRELLGLHQAKPSPPECVPDLIWRLAGKDITRCAHCRRGHLKILRRLARNERILSRPHEVPT